MNLIRAFRCWRLNRQIDHALAVRRAARKWRSEAAQKGWQNRGRA